jgi:phosphate transport system permease protein
VVSPEGPFSKFTTLPAQVYQWTSRPNRNFSTWLRRRSSCLLVLLITLNAFAIWLRNRYSRRII